MKRWTWLLVGLTFGSTAYAQQDPSAEPAGSEPIVAPVVAPPAADAAAAAPQPSSPAPAPAAPVRPPGAPQVGIAPGTPQIGTLLVSAPPETSETTTPGDGGWHFDFHGFLRAPMRIGVGSGDTAAPEAGQGMKLHAPPFVPDGTFTDWRYTNSLPGPWVELRFIYGNARVKGNVLIDAYNITDGGYRNLQAQLGIDQAFISMDYSDLFEAHGGIVWNVGVFQNRYGAAGRYDAGKYETYLFGRTHVAGETLTAFYHLNDDLTLTFEHGLGAKLEPIPRVTGLPEPTPAYLPYAGPTQQGNELVHHAHLMLSVGAHLQIGLHYLSTWTDDARLATEKDGRTTVTGLDAKVIDSRYGDGYLGYSHIDAKNPNRVGEGLEVLHSISGWNLRDNYFGQMSTNGGTIDTVLFQYTLSLARFLRYPEPFWGQGPDLALSLFGMFNHVASSDPTFKTSKTAQNKVKGGAEATYTPLGFLGLSLRFDRVETDLDQSSLGFSALSPRIILRSEFVTHEQVILSYTHYFYGKDVTPAWPSAALPPDKDAFMIAAIMWW